MFICYNILVAYADFALRGGKLLLENDKINILVADDEADIRKILRLLLQKKGYTVYEAANGVEAVEFARRGEADLIVMDIMMPCMSGIEATAKIREFSTAPVLFLTARSLDSDKNEAYSGGGDDYLVKPFSSAELLMKIEALLRRYMVYKGKADVRSQSLPCGVEIDVDKRAVWKNGNEVVLRDKERDVLFYLFERRGSTVDTNSLYEDVWQEKIMQTSSNNVMVNILNLRKKLEDDPSAPKLIKTVWGKGYRFE